MFNKDQSSKRIAEVVGFIGKGVRVEGKLSFEKTVRIDGDFCGEVTAGDTLIVGEGARVEGIIRSATIVVTGTVVGEIEAGSRVELHAPGRIEGEIRTPNLIIGDGGVFEGTCKMTNRNSGAQ